MVPTHFTDLMYANSVTLFVPTACNTAAHWVISKAAAQLGLTTVCAKTKPQSLGSCLLFTNTGSIVELVESFVYLGSLQFSLGGDSS